MRQKDRMQKAGRDPLDQAPGPTWLSTARRAMRSGRMAGRLFAAGHDGEAGDATFENIAESFEETVPVDDLNAPASIDQSAAATNVASERKFQKSDPTSRERVVLFAPGPITEAALARANSKRAAIIRKRQRQRRRWRWFIDNAGTIVVAIALAVVAWFVAAG